VLIVVTAIHQPFNQNELQQMAPYGSSSLAKIAGGTRQPPLDPWLGSLLQHLLGQGQLRQRLVPVGSGVASLTLMALLLRRFRLGAGGVLAVALMATAPLMVRFSAYTRPYALPMFLMIAFVWAAQHWLEEGARRWVVVAGLAAVLLPLARVPEPTIFLLTTALALGWHSVRGRLAWERTRPLIAVALAALVLVGYPMFHLLAAKTESLWRPSPAAIVHRFPAGLHELLTGAIPLLADWLPWWPITVAVAVAAVAVRDSRRRLADWWFCWPLLLAPVGFLVAYHFLTDVDFTALPYRSRAAYFFVPPYALAVAALAGAAWEATSWPRRLRAGTAALLAAALLGQLPTTVERTSQLDAPDFAAVSRLLEKTVPADAIVLYDRPSTPGQSSMGFLSRHRYLAHPASVVDIATLDHDRAPPPVGAPVYLLVNGQCTAGSCENGALLWTQPVPGWRLVATTDRFSLYAPADGQRGPTGAVAGLTALGRALGPALGFRETFAAAALLVTAGRDARAKQLVQQLYAAAGPAAAAEIRREAKAHDLDPTN
jgi:hypothetical protein